MRLTPVVFCAVLLTLVGCGSGDQSGDAQSTTSFAPALQTIATEPPASTSPESSTLTAPTEPFLGTLTFDWPIGCAVPVEEHVTKDGQVALLDYMLRAEPADADIRISYENMTVVELNGEVVSPATAARVAAAFTLPDFIVGVDGTEIGVDGIEEMIAQLTEAGLVDGANFTPQLIAVLEETVLTKYWSTWVGLWAGLGSIDQERAELALPLPIGDIEVTLDLVVESFASEVPGEAKLRSVQSLTGDDFLLSIGATQEQIGAQPSPDSSQLADGHRITTIELTTDPATLRPRTASFTNDIELTINGTARAEVEKREWLFDWPNMRCD